MTLRTLNYGNYGIFLIVGHAGFCPSAVGFGSCFNVLANSPGEKRPARAGANRIVFQRSRVRALLGF